jgi:hypothetical protein
LFLSIWTLAFSSSFCKRLIFHPYFIHVHTS